MACVRGEERAHRRGGRFGGWFGFGGGVGGVGGVGGGWRLGGWRLGGRFGGGSGGGGGCRRLGGWLHERGCVLNSSGGGGGLHFGWSFELATLHIPMPFKTVEGVEVGVKKNGWLGDPGTDGNRTPNVGCRYGWRQAHYAAQLAGVQWLSG